MKRKLLCSIAMAASFAASTLGTAHASSPSTEEKMLDACIHHYIESNLGDYQGKVTVNKMDFGQRSMVFGAKTQVTVAAVHRTSGEHLGTVACDVSSNGTITMAKPHGAAAAKLAKLNKSPVIASTSAE